MTIKYHGGEINNQSDGTYSASYYNRFYKSQCLAGGGYGFTSIEIAKEEIDKFSSELDKNPKQHTKFLSDYPEFD